jgi:hypothetical protein
VLLKGSIIEGKYCSRKTLFKGNVFNRNVKPGKFYPREVLFKGNVNRGKCYSKEMFSRDECCSG